MAESYNLDVVFNGRDNGVQKTASLIKNSFAFGAAAKMGGAAISALGNAATSAARDIVSVGGNFTSAMSEVGAISGATAGDMDKLTAKAKEMGATTSFSASDSADAMKYMAMAGWDTQDMLDGISGIMDLAAASGENLGTTSDIVTDALTAFGMQANQAGDFADILAATSSKANTNVGMLGESFKYVAPVAGALGYSAKDTSFALGLMANSGIKASSAGTALRTMMTNLSKPTAEMSSAMSALGVSITDSSGEMLPLKSVIDNLRSSFSGLSEDQKAQYAATLAGKEGMSGLLAIVNASENDYNKLAGALDNCTGEAARMKAEMLDNLPGDMTLLKSAIEGVQISIYEALEPALRAIVQWTTKNVIPAIQKMVDFIKGIDVSKFTKPFENMNIDWGKVLGVAGAIVGFTAIKNAAGKLSSLNPFKTIAKTSRSSLAQIIKSFGSFTKDFGKGLESTFKGLGKAMEGAGKGMGAMLKQANPANILAVGGAVAIAAAGFALLATQGDGVATIISSIGEAAGYAAEGIGRGLAPVIEAIGPVAQNLGKGIAEAASGIGEGVGMIIQAFQPLLPGINAIVQSVGMVIMHITECLPDIIASIGEMVSMIVTAFQPIVDTLSTAFVSVVQIVSDAIVQIVETLAPYIPDLTVMITQIATVFGDVAIAVAEAITQIMIAIAPFIPDIMNVATVVGTAIHDICTVFQDLIAVIPPVLEQLDTIINDVFTGIQTTLEAFGTAVKDVGEGLKLAFEGVGDVIESFGNAVSGILDSVAGAIDSIGTAALNAGSGFEKLANGIKTITSLNLFDMGASLAAAAGGVAAMAAAAAGIGDAGNQIFAMGEGLINIAAAGMQAAMVGYQLDALCTSMTNLGQTAPQMLLAATAMQTMADGATTAFGGLAGSMAILTMMTGQLTSFGNSVMTIAAAFPVFSSGAQLALAALTGLGSVFGTIMVQTSGLTGQFMMLQEALIPTGAAFMAAMMQMSLSAAQGMAMTAESVRSGTSQVVAALSGMGDAMSVSVAAAFSEVASIVLTAMNAVALSVTATTAQIVRGIQTALRPLPAYVKMTVNQVVASMKAGGNMAKSAGSAMGAGFVSGLQGKIGLARSAGGAIASAASKAMGSASAYSTAYSSGSYVGQGFYDGLNSQLSRIRHLSAEIIKVAEEATRKAGQIKSPSRLFKKLGGYVGEGFAIGIESMYGRIEEAAGGMMMTPSAALAGGSLSIDGGTLTSPDDELMEIHVHSHLGPKEVAHETYRYTKKEAAADTRLQSILGGVR